MQEPGHLREFDVDFTIVSMFQFLEWTRKYIRKNQLSVQKFCQNFSLNFKENSDPFWPTKHQFGFGLPRFSRKIPHSSKILALEAFQIKF